MRAPDWLTARPVAHRGLHDISRGIVENMPGAVQAAIAGNFSIEVDIQLSADGEATVHHDHALGRLTEATGPLVEKTATELKALTFKDTAERMMSLSDLCALVGGRVPLVIEVKSRFDRDRKLVKRMAEVLASYDGPAVGMSFDPDQVLALRELLPSRPRGIVAQRSYQDDYWAHLTQQQRDSMLYLRHGFQPSRSSSPLGSTTCPPPPPGSPAMCSAALYWAGPCVRPSSGRGSRNMRIR